MDTTESPQFVERKVRFLDVQLAYWQTSTSYTLIGWGDEPGDDTLDISAIHIHALFKQRQEELHYDRGGNGVVGYSVRKSIIKVRPTGPPGGDPGTSPVS